MMSNMCRSDFLIIFQKDYNTDKAEEVVVGFQGFAAKNQSGRPEISQIIMIMIIFTFFSLIVNYIKSQNNRNLICFYIEQPTF